MLKPSFTKQFERDLKKSLKRGKKKDILKAIITKLINEEQLESKYRDHKLTGSYMGRRECHIEPDWLLIYKITGNQIVFERTGTHSDLF
ncbi:type II toxin-antitoxin system YafQ family toxin [candidate division KSB1 bacterium]|nr:type II toxin-antitoxin system YafQ family toxin [candidate division KSB1 bacterium]